MNLNHYTYRVTWSPEDGEHVGLCVEFPSLSWLADKPQAALAGIPRVVADVDGRYSKIGRKWLLVTGGPCEKQTLKAPLNHRANNKRNAAFCASA
jgi:hypothetical protein